MAFFKGNEQLDTLQITGQYNPGSITLDSIKLPNNSTLNLSLAGIQVNPSNPDITNIDQIDTLKIVIKWGDGESETISPYFHVTESSINTKYQDWTSISHLYSLKSTEQSLSLTVNVYNLLNDCASITVPIIIQFQSLLEAGAKLTLVGANITNDNKVSYVLNNMTDKSSFVVSSL